MATASSSDLANQPAPPGPTEPSVVLRPDIALSWRRCELSGLAPTLPTSHLQLEDVDPRSALQLAADPVLRRLEQDLAGTGFTFILADRDCRVVRGWSADSVTAHALEHRNVGLGSVLREEAAGTNAVGTAVETGRGVIIHGEEHFLDSFKTFSCYAEPIRHPVTRRIEGVLDVTVLGPTAQPLFAAIVRSAVAQIEDRLLAGSRAGELSLLRAFRAASARRSSAVVALDDEVVLADRAALDLLHPQDYGVLRVFAAALAARSGSGAATEEIPLASGVTVCATAHRVEGTTAGAVIHLRPPKERRPRRPSAPATQASAPVLVTGPAGSGRSTVVRELVGAADSVVRADDPNLSWAFHRALVTRAPTVGIDDVDLMPATLVRRFVAHIASGGPPRLVLSCGPLDALPPHLRPLVSVCLDRRELLPLAQRVADLPDLAARALRRAAPGSTARLTPSVVEVLAGQEWPGGLHELDVVMRHVAQRRTSGDVTVADLPESHRGAAGMQRLSSLDRAEREAIVRALRSHGGNKLRAAADLGVSRTTLYARIRALRITAV